MGVTLLLALVFVVPKHVEGISGVMPLVHLVPVFIWTVLHPRDMRLVFVALVGLLVDVATALPLGLSALSYALFVMMVRSQRKYIYREGFIAMWGYFSMLLLALQLVSWGFASSYYAIRLPMGSALWQWVLTVALYPLLHVLCIPLVESMARIHYRLQHS